MDLTTYAMKPFSLPGKIDGITKNKIKVLNSMKSYKVRKPHFKLQKGL